MSVAGPIVAALPAKVNVRVWFCKQVMDEHMDEFCTPESNNSPTWTLLDLVIWKAWPEQLGGGTAYSRRFKDAWVVHNKSYIKAAAAKYSLPIELLAGVCWIEVGGDPNFVDRIGFEVRALERLGNLSSPITNPPAKTSFGWVSIQLRTAAVTLGMNPDEMDISQLRSLANCIETDIYNIDIAAKHLRMLADYDHFSSIGMEEARIIGARYNWGTSRSLDEIKKDLSYGNFIVNSWSHLKQLTM
ncbi:hypothetical protein ALP73_100692 [Pseudomonas coronafaciens pv. garcae]|uniref:Uncharacterized protein n=2 Tax=Pseudomonas syringae group TaxID=136849 RepID=A0AB37QJR4_9PSED|nr:hypothetical protein ALP74_100671 [Pseudomonas coronafaciens pv. garcae]RMS07705.1 hypothetical protein ALP73_100692 [Pseudomonas coronafaciens pv. garcae]RMS39348.1 hypothetical protein ALP71_02091 [Pseudomonas coronafaciens pv. garcae]RMU93694.1 hypothetical protein ALP20_00299 [Pseudomonas coronafaciens pv. coronafaciens]